ncbi:MAG: hypothetical protein HPY70_04290 [Firmicutes bacterium]|nr:hypothetical protein [Bacillota bacterium]
MKRLAGSVMRVLYRKELIDHIRSKRFLIILFLVAVTGIASIYSAGYGIYRLSIHLILGFLYHSSL